MEQDGGCLFRCFQENKPENTDLFSFICELEKEEPTEK